MSDIEKTKSIDFIRRIAAVDLKNNGRIITRFPPEPNGYLHIGHAKSIYLNFSIAIENQGKCNLRFDDTNPIKEDVEYIKSIMKDISWLGFDWDGEAKFASDYFQKFYNYAIELIKLGTAYVCSLNAEDTRKYRGTLKEGGVNSPNRNRSIEENLDLFEKMKNGEFEDGAHTLKAKIDMSSPNINMRDPTLYRIRHQEHHQTGKSWCIYPLYDYAHCISDSIEGVTHSLCTLEFEDHRPLYDWILNQLKVDSPPRQFEFSRLNLEYTITSKRKLRSLVDEKLVVGWDDPRMPTISGMRNRGYTPDAIKMFCRRIGISKIDSATDLTLLEDCVRDDLEVKAKRVMGVLDPLKLVIENYPKNKTEELNAKYHPKDESKGNRNLPFEKEIYIEHKDFEESPPPKYKRLFLGGEVRLRYSYVIRCNQVIKDEKTGEILELRCTFDSETLGKNPEGRKVKGVIHWVAANHSISAEVHLYDRLFLKPLPEGSWDEQDFKSYFNPKSCTTKNQAKVEASLVDTELRARFQFERVGYFVVDAIEGKSQKLSFNRIVTLRDSWKKIRSG